ncbi:MAG: cytochrome C [Hyphomicrobiaceae bacterium]
MTKSHTRVAVMLATVLGFASMAHADAPKPPPGSALAGKGIAKLKCAGCHNVDKNDKPSPNLKAPPFVVIAKTQLVTVREVDQWLQAAHHDMPDLSLDSGQRGDIIAYLQSLSPKDPIQ